MFSRDAASGRLTPLAGTGGLPARQPRHLRARHAASTRPRRSRSRRTATSLYVTSDRRHPDVVPARRDDRDAHPAAARIRLPERRRPRRLHADRRARARIGRRRLARRAHRDRRGHRRRRRASRSGATRPRGALTRVSCVAGIRRHGRLHCSRPLIARPARASPCAPTGASSGSRRPAADSIVTLQIDPATGVLTPTRRRGRLPAAPGLARTAAPRARSTTRAGSPSSADGLARLRRQRAQRRHRRARARSSRPTACTCARRRSANKAHSVVLACSDPNGDKIALHDRPPAQARPAERPRQGDREHHLHALPRATRAPTRSPTRATRRAGRQRRRARPR